MSSYEVAPAYEGLRRQVLSLQPEAVGVVDGNAVLAVLMEMGFAEAAVTLVSVADGTTSLYFSNGGGVIGAGQHDAPRHESQQFLATAQGQVAVMEEVSEFPLPEPDHTRFYVVTGSGVFSADSPEPDLGDGHHALSPLYIQGHRVITVIRKMQEE